MIFDHKGKVDNNSVVRQDTSKNKSPLLLLNPSGNTDSASLSGDGGSLLITKQKPAFIPLPRVDSVRQNSKPKVYFNPLKTAEYLKYKDTYFELSDGSLLYTQKPFNQKEEFKNKIQGFTKKAKQENLAETTDIATIIEQPDMISNNWLIKESNISSDNATQWVLGVLIFITIIFAWIRVFNNKYLRNIRTAFFNNQWSKKLYEERNVISQRNSLVLNFFFIVNASLLLVYILKYFKYTLLGLGGLQTFFVFILLVSFIYFIKFFLLQLTGWIVMAKTHFGEYIHNVFIYNKLYGIILFPILWTIPFVDQKVSGILIFAAVGLFGTAYLFRIFRGILNCIRLNVSLFYLILYLCALEIFPMLIIYKTITSVM